MATYGTPGTPTYSVTFNTVDSMLASVPDNNTQQIGSGDLRNSLFTLWDKMDSIAIQSQHILTSVTRSEIDTLIQSNSLQSGTMYRISEVDIDLYGGTDIFLIALSDNKLSRNGWGLFYNPIYNQNEDDYGIFNPYIYVYTTKTSTENFVANEIVYDVLDDTISARFTSYGALLYVSGNWNSTSQIVGSSSNATADVVVTSVPDYPEDSPVIWGGKLWINKTGNIGNSNNIYTLDSTNWNEVSFNEEDYDLVLDEISYDYQNDKIVARKDYYGNNIEFTHELYSIHYSSIFKYDPIKSFQWGNKYSVTYDHDDSVIQKGVGMNNVINSCCENINSMSLFILNDFNYSTFYNNKMLLGSKFYNNRLSMQSYFYSNILTNTECSHGRLEESSIQSNDMNYALLTRNFIEKSEISSNKIVGSSDHKPSIDNNNLTQDSTISYNTIYEESEISNNQLSISNIEINNINNSYINDNILAKSSLDSNTFVSTTIENVTLRSSTFTIVPSGLTMSNIVLSKLEVKDVNLWPDLTVATDIYLDCSKTVFKKSDGSVCLSYINGSNTIVITDVDT